MPGDWLRWQHTIAESPQFRKRLMTTTFLEGSATRTWGGHQAVRCSEELLGCYHQIIDEQRLSWTEHHRLIRLLGSGGQGVVYLSERRGTDKFHPAGGAEGLLARTLRRRAGLRRGDGPDGPGRRPRGPNPAGQPAGRSQLGRSPPHPHDGDGMGRRLRPRPSAHPPDARTSAEPG